MSLVWILAKTDFRLRYQGSVLGFLWALLKPLALFAVLLFVFSHIFSADVPYYSFQLLTALLMWMFFAEGTMTGLTSLQAKAHVLKKIAFPRVVVVLAAVLQSVMTFALHLLFLFLVFFFSSITISLVQFLSFFVLIVLTILLVLAFSLVAAPLYIRFRDLHQIWEVLLLVGFYAAPVLYPLSVLPVEYHDVLYLNPMTFLLVQSKEVLFSGALIDSFALLQYSALLLVFLFFSALFFKRSQSRVIELL